MDCCRAWTGGHGRLGAGWDTVDDWRAQGLPAGASFLRMCVTRVALVVRRGGIVKDIR
ncbi:hypothetical protein ACFPN7_23575 [Amycolatopsis halotolerans]|uniref:hypothetical protein n=1 Tax=Amycolatopsis halotolerans TaxID=330083 RepID=UPI00361A06E0